LLAQEVEDLDRLAEGDGLVDAAQGFLELADGVSGKLSGLRRLGGL
jgi:hypothetical protein